LVQAKLTAKTTSSEARRRGEGAPVANRQCGRIKSNGSRCKGVATGSNGLCYAHDPANEQARLRHARRGGRAGGRGRPSVELQRIGRRFEDLSEEVLSGELDARVGAVAGQLLNGARACIRDTLVAIDQEQVLEEMEEIREALDAQRARRPGVS
jgi:hypothetical protein